MRGSGRQSCCALSAREALPRLGPAERPPAVAVFFSSSSSSGTPNPSPAAALAPWPASRRAMSKVRVSNGSPTLERMEGRPADAPKPSACRCLFGPVDRQELAREWQDQSRHLEETSRRRWNFDFRRGQPLEGRFEWQALDKAALPDFYSRPPRLGGARPKADGRERRLELNGDRSPLGGLRFSQAPAEQEPEPEPQEQQDGAALTLSSGPRKRPAADDSSPPSKRANTTEEISEDPSEDPPMASSEEQTPKKKTSSPKRCQT
ncbi:cyclin-dependent kinase inhibitor 1B [Pantherophis guttatus]|uniref:Cyclin-dependent kinase inhibitor 1B n=1 Tax=Pantherophis guttatus TaxID=94885 RepID=A0A6P9DYX5_PANGU|nr:cyclin-dependent kinase inhibitor 1B [Pantherophis guttatus]